MRRFTTSGFIVGEREKGPALASFHNWGGWGSRPELCSETLSQKQIVMGAGPDRLVGNGASRTCGSGRRE